MSLGKLLSTGRSLVGGAPDAGRYNISSANRLPKFGSAKNPFAPSATSDARPASAEPSPAPPVEMPPVAAQPSAQIMNEWIVQPDDTQRIPELADQPFGPMSGGSQLSVASVSLPNRLKAGLQTGASLARRWMKSFWRVARTGAVAAVAAACRFKWGSSVQVCGSLAGGVWRQIRRTGPLGGAAWGKVKSISTKLAGLFRKREPKSVIPRFGKPAVQTELSLDRVTVVRNSLEDSDLEVVTAETATSTQVAPKMPAASPKRGPVPPALKKMTERLLGVPALD